MDRRSFAENVTVTMGGVFGVGRPALNVVQEQTAQFTFLDEAVAHGNTVLTMTRGTSASAEAGLLADELFNAVSYGIQGDSQNAFSSLGNFQASTDVIAGEVFEIAGIRGVPQFGEMFVAAPERFESTMERWLETGNWVVYPMPMPGLRCVVSCVEDHLGCFEPVARKILGCGIKALPGLWFRGAGYVAVFAGCMIEAVPDLAVDLFLDCLPSIEVCVNECIER